MRKPDQSESQLPVDQANEQHGKIKSRQRSERDTHDVARGAEPETRAASGPRG